MELQLIIALAHGEYKIILGIDKMLSWNIVIQNTYLGRFIFTNWIVRLDYIMFANKDTNFTIKLPKYTENSWFLLKIMHISYAENILSSMN